jgi:hypothetical protein
MSTGTTSVSFVCGFGHNNITEDPRDWDQQHLQVQGGGGGIDGKGGKGSKREI